MAQVTSALPSRPVSVTSTIVAAAGLLVMLIVVPPWQPGMPAAGLEPSWVMALREAFTKGLHWGPEVVITFGPLGFAYGNAFEPHTFGYTLAIWCLLAVAMGLGLIAVTRRLGWPTSVVATAGIVIAAASPDVLFFLVPILLVLCWACTEGTGRRVALAVLLIAMMFITQMKLSALPSCLLAVLLIDGARITERRWPGYTILYLAGVLGTWLLAGQRITDIPTYVAGTLQVIRGYDGAMQIFGPDRETVQFLACALLSACWFGWCLWRRSGSLTRTRRVIVGLIVLAVVQISFKAGFVRHDLHSLLSWLALCGCCSLLLTVPFSFGRDRPAAWAALLLPVLPLVGYTATFRHVLPVSSLVAVENFGPSILVARAGHAAEILFGNGVQQLEAQRQAALKAIAADTNLPRVQGSVDIVPSRQAELIAQGADYRPRPVFQAYAAYTADLAERNREFFAGPRAPDNVIFQPEPLDDRYAATVDGLTWLEFLGRYQPLSLAPDTLLLQKRDSAVAPACSRGRQPKRESGRTRSNFGRGRAHRPSSPA